MFKISNKHFLSVNFLSFKSISRYSFVCRIVLSYKSQLTNLLMECNLPVPISLRHWSKLKLAPKLTQELYEMNTFNVNHLMTVIDYIYQGSN